VPSWASELELSLKDLLQVVDLVASWYAKRMSKKQAADLLRRQSELGIVQPVGG